MAPVINKRRSKRKLRPRVLVVDDEPKLLELVHDVVGRDGNCRCSIAARISRRHSESSRASRSICCRGRESSRRQRHVAAAGPSSEHPPTAATIVITGKPSSTARSIAIARAPSISCPSLSPPIICCDRINKALEHQATLAKKEIVSASCAVAVKRLNTTRRTSARKSICSATIWSPRTANFPSSSMRSACRKASATCSPRPRISSSCFATRWTGCCASSGYCNVAIWLASEDDRNSSSALT